MSKFVVTTDSCADFFKKDYQKMDVPYIIIKRVLNGVEVEDMYDSEAECNAFYESLRKGERPTTVALNTQEFEQFWGDILDRTEGDIIHVCLSSGLSLTYDNAVKAAANLKEKLGKRKIHVIDSLIATWGMGIMVEKLCKMRDEGIDTTEAVKRAEYTRDRLQGWVAVSDLFHLKRGGRISGAKAMIGTVLGIKPIIVIAKNGKLAIQNKMKGVKKAASYLLSKIEEMGGLVDGELRLIYSTKGEVYDEIKSMIAKTYPKMKVTEGIVGPVIGTHLGSNAVAILFEGIERLDI